MKVKLMVLTGLALALVGCGVGNLDQGQVKYTPGVPPWQEQDPNKKGPGGAPGQSQQAAQAPAGQTPGQGQVQNTTEAPAGGLPPGMTPPQRGMGKP